LRPARFVCARPRAASRPLAARGRRWLAPVPLALGAGCASSIPLESPALSGWEEPLALFEEPQDEEQRRELDAGSFSGLALEDARDSLEAMLGDPRGLVVASIVENSPAEAAALRVGDILLEVDAGAGSIELAWPSQWGEIELSAPAGTVLTLVYDRAGSERETELTLVERVRPARRIATERFREDLRVGVVVRTATEVEARAAGLAPGAGAVVVGLGQASPWRSAGILFEDLIVAVDGEPVAHPQVVLDAIRSARKGQVLRLEVVRAGGRLEVDAPLTQRTREWKKAYIPLIYRYENDGQERTLSFLLGIFKCTSTDAAWRMRILWIFSFQRGDADRLDEMDA